MSEAEFQKVVIDLARRNGWLVYHAVPAQVRPGVWRTTYAGDRGFPDLMMVHPTRGGLFAELKTDKGKVTYEQEQWLDTLQQAGYEAYCWRPAMLDIIMMRLGA
jgi:hypothetical protein